MGVCKAKLRDCQCNRCRHGWWSRRHQSRDAQDAARERYQLEHGRKARQKKADERRAA